ncbi:MAG TPA: pyridoxamine 5'-phosphate oxidase [Pyrinomonadaceae bacterium]|nr:pyridoxamine 5'-phosphate oxidase [Pyrinomonadaceae bacterium]
MADLRRDYSSRELTEESIAADPFTQFAAWMNDVLEAELKDPTAMTLSTVGADGSPSSRIVLLKGFDADGFVFFTNYKSNKGRDLTGNHNAVIHFFWAELERQINVQGSVTRTSAEESDEYFNSRPFESRIGALASDQSEQIASRTILEERVAELSEKYADGNVPRPPHWGGFRLTPNRFEFWQGRPSRLHDRICYKLENGQWMISRLAP